MDSKLTESSFMAKNNKLHIAMFPWLALGHLIPYLELAKLIAKKGHTISFISTPRNIDRLQKITPDLVPLIHFVKLPLPYVENLSRDAEATSDVTLKDIGLLVPDGARSVVEALQFARALVLLTFYADQGLNAKVFEEKKVGFLVSRQEHDGSFTRKSVAESLRMVIVEEEGKVYRDKAKELKGLLGDVHRQNLLVENFLDHLQTRKCMKISYEING